MTLLLHALGANYNQYLGSRNQSQFGERGPGSIVITPLGAAGRTAATTSYAEADVFEMWADVARHYKLDPAWTVDHRLLDGRLSARSSSPSSSRTCSPRAADRRRQRATTDMVASLRNIPVLMWNAADGRARPRRPYLADRARRSTRSATATSSTCSRRRAPHARDQRRVRAGGRVPRHAHGRPQPGARHLRAPTRALDYRRRSASSPTTPTGSRGSLRDGRDGRPGHRRRALVRLRRRRPDRRARPSSARARWPAATSARSPSRASARRGARRRRRQGGPARPHGDERLALTIDP